jgi:nucleoid-associated protein YgaU
VEKERKASRRTQVVEVELHSPIKFERMPKRKPVEPVIKEKPLPVQPTEDSEVWGNRGYLKQGVTSAQSEVAVQPYTVQKGDTLQKISKKFYGTTKKWKKIYEANTAVLKGPDKVYPGQTINIPVDSKGTSLKEPIQNLK